LCEELARRLNALHGIPMIALRLSNVLFTDRDHPANYAAIPGYWGDPWSRKFNLWGYIDARDAARGARLALESDVTGAEAYIVSAADTIMMQDNATLMAAVFPDVEIDPELGPYETLLSIDKAAKDFGWAPQHSWRTVLRREDLQPA
jgi:nucleoside-diphosphate-sugar epimerase